MANRVKLSQKALTENLAVKRSQIEDLEQKISGINISIHRLSQKFHQEAAKIQHKITKIQFSRPRGNPAHHWPHRPMTSQVRAFYQVKDRKEGELRRSQNLLKQTFDHDKALLTSSRLVLESALFDLESQVRLINIQLH